MNGLSVMKRTASTSSSIFAVSSAITFLSGKPMPAAMTDLCALASARHDLPLDHFPATIDQRLLVGTLDVHLIGRRPPDFLQRDRSSFGGRRVVISPDRRGRGGVGLARRFVDHGAGKIGDAGEAAPGTPLLEPL